VGIIGVPRKGHILPTPTRLNRASGGVFFMLEEPKEKRVIAFFDGQNVFHSVKRAFGYQYANYDPKKLAETICSSRPGWKLLQTRFYTGIPSVEHDPAHRAFWNAKLAWMGRLGGVQTYSRDLKYEEILFPTGTMGEASFHQPREKGIDIRIAIEIIGLASACSIDVALVFSQDQDFTEVVGEVKRLSGVKRAWMKVASAFPISAMDKRDGIHGAIPIPFDQALYDQCLDTRDYRKVMQEAEDAAKRLGAYKPRVTRPFNPLRIR
jgi:hypothetical protein